jgi:hypothetical protein
LPGQSNWQTGGSVAQQGHSYFCKNDFNIKKESISPLSSRTVKDDISHDAENGFEGVKSTKAAESHKKEEQS